MPLKTLVRAFHTYFAVLESIFVTYGLPEVRIFLLFPLPMDGTSRSGAVRQSLLVILWPQIDLLD
jgi:hypothetical protein